MLLLKFVQRGVTEFPIVNVTMHSTKSLRRSATVNAVSMAIRFKESSSFLWIRNEEYSRHVYSEETLL